MDKRITFNSVDALGAHFAEAIDITQRGGGLEKMAGEKPPEVVRFLRNLRPDPRYQYVLMAPMGSYEHWGMNVNGDIFPEISLSYDCLAGGSPERVIKALADRWLAPFGHQLPPGHYSSFGYKTFLEALRYRNHVNKNSDIAYGDIVLSVWNPAMRRVEVIARHDREKAKRVGADEIIRDIDENKPRQISMGCRVPFDVCTKCGHISRVSADYCDCLRYAMGAINGDGTVNGAVNFFPRFFDLSDVIVPAAKESGVLMKVAEAGPLHGLYFEVPKALRERHESGMAKTASVKLSFTDKRAEMQKRVLSNNGEESIQSAMDAEPDIASPVLRGADMGTLLTTLAALGIILKPHEFQDASLSRMGLGHYRDALASRRLTFCPAGNGGNFLTSFSPDSFDPRLATALESLIPARSAFYPHLPQRVLHVTLVGVGTGKEPMGVAPDSPPLRKIASAYQSYRNAFRGLPGLIDVAVERNLEYYNRNFFGDLLDDSMLKQAASLHEVTLSTPLVPLYVYNAYHGRLTEPPPAWDLPTAHHSPARALVAPVL